MKLSLRLIPILGMAFTLVTYFAAQMQVPSEKRGVPSDVERHAETLAESSQETVEPVAQSGVTSQLRRLVERFASRERIVVIAVHDGLVKAMAASSKLPPIVAAVPP